MQDQLEEVIPLFYIRWIGTVLQNISIARITLELTNRKFFYRQ